MVPSGVILAEQIWRTSRQSHLPGDLLGPIALAGHDDLPEFVSLLDDAFLSGIRPLPFHLRKYGDESARLVLEATSVDFNDISITECDTLAASLVLLLSICDERAIDVIQAKTVQQLLDCRRGCLQSLGGGLRTFWKDLFDDTVLSSAYERLNTSMCGPCPNWFGLGEPAVVLGWCGIGSAFGDEECIRYLRCMQRHENVLPERWRSQLTWWIGWLDEQLHTPPSQPSQ